MSHDIIIIVSDNGVGFDTTKPLDKSRDHIGIANIRERIRMMCGGRLDISSTIGVGTTITITIPKQEEAIK